MGRVAQYRERIVDQILADRLAAAGAVVIEGPRACGKTATARRVAASEVLFDVDRRARQALDIDPALVLDGPTPRLLDEWQVGGDAIWNSVRRAVDDRGEPGQFVLTGSATPADSVTRHTGAGRFSVLRMRPMCLHERGHSSGAMSLGDLFAGDEPTCPDPGVDLADLVDLIAVGGWPGNLNHPVGAAVQSNHDYLAQIREVDIRRLEAGRRDPLRVERLLRSLARNIATEVKVTTLSKQAGSAGDPLARTTTYEYLDALERLMVIEDQPAWSTHLRSAAVLRTTPKRHFADPSLAIAALGASRDRLRSDFEYLGCLFESLVVAELRVLSQQLGGTVYHYRDSSGLEVDAIVQLADGRWGAFEAKLGAGQIDAAAAHLVAFANRVDTTKAGAPTVLAVVTLASYGYTRPDSVAVIPVAALRP